MGFDGSKPGPGRKKGVPNKIGADIRAMMFEALEQAGGVEYLVRQAKKRNPAPFLALLGKCLPKDVKLTSDTELNVTLIGVKREG